MSSWLQHQMTRGSVSVGPCMTSGLVTVPFEYSFKVCVCVEP